MAGMTRSRCLPHVYGKFFTSIRIGGGRLLGLSDNGEKKIRSAHFGGDRNKAGVGVNEDGASGRRRW